jgi:hypothetical protein
MNEMFQNNGWNLCINEKEHFAYTRDGYETEYFEIKKKYPSNVKFLFFLSHVGTYVIRNTLAKESAYEKLLFFDSDDVMNNILVNTVNKELNDFQHVRYNYHTFNGVLTENIKRSAKPGNHFHTGTFGILKEIFLQNNGFEPWVCASDGEFYWRVTKNNLKRKDLPILGMFYRRHGNNLTSSSKTHMNSPLRRMYHNIKEIKIKNNLYHPLKELKISNFTNITDLNIKSLSTLLKSDINYEISVIIPVFDNTEYVDECISSIINSGKNRGVEILIGIDGCQKTLDHLKLKNYPDFIKIYYFNGNKGPYDIKNTLTLLSKSNKILFFDSDDIMNGTAIDDSIDRLNNHDIVKLKYQRYVGGVIKTNQMEFGEGVFAINKELFLNMNGFEGWICAADSDFMSRLYKKKPRIYHTNNVSFYYRRHNKNLTERKETGMMSSLRSNYSKLIKNKKGDGNPIELCVRDFILVEGLTLEYVEKTQEYYNIRKTQLDKVLNPVPRKVVGIIKKSDPVIRDRVDILYNNPKPLNRVIKPNKPDDRQALINLKNNTNKSINKVLFSTIPNRRTGINPITIGGKSHI